MSDAGLQHRDVGPALPGQPDAGPAAPPPGKRSLTAMLPPKADSAVEHTLIVRPEVPKHKRTAAPAPTAEDPFALHITLAQAPAKPPKRTASPEAVKAIEHDEAAASAQRRAAAADQGAEDASPGDDG